MRLYLKFFNHSKRISSLSRFHHVSKSVEKITNSEILKVIETIYNDIFENLFNALEVLGQKTLESRQNLASLKLAKRCQQHPKMAHLFKRATFKTWKGPTFSEPTYKKASDYKGQIPF